MKILLFLVLLYLFLALLLYVFQRRFLYYPTPYIKTDLETLVVESSKERLEVFVVNPGLKKAVIYFGGNAESVAETAFLVEKSVKNQTLYLVNYRGYGGSTGKPSEEALYKDAIKVYDTIKEKHQDISVFGRSLGTSVATYLAVKRYIKKVVLVTPFDSITNVARKSFPIFPVSILIKDSHESAKRASEIKVPVLVLIGEEDQVIPASCSGAFVQALDKKLARVIRIEHADHNDIALYDEYTKAVISFLKD